MSINYNTRIVTNGLVLCLDAANPKSYPGTGTTWYDLSGNGNIGALTNNTIYTVDNNGSILFNGIDNYVTLSQSLVAKTIISWCKLSTAAGGDYIVYGLDANGSDNWFGINANKVYVFATQLSDINNFVLTGSTVFNTSTYYQICCTIDTNTVKVYVNGIEEASSTKEFTIGSWNTAPTIGRRGNISQRYFPGYIANVFVYNTILNSFEIQQNFNATRGRYGI